MQGQGPTGQRHREGPAWEICRGSLEGSWSLAADEMGVLSKGPGLGITGLSIMKHGQQPQKSPPASHGASGLRLARHGEACPYQHLPSGQLLKVLIHLDVVVPSIPHHQLALG